MIKFIYREGKQPQSQPNKTMKRTKITFIKSGKKVSVIIPSGSVKLKIEELKGLKFEIVSSKIIYV